MKATGLWKKCPRCGRMGEVLFDEEHTEPGNPAYVIEWQGKGSVHSNRDTLVRPHDLLDAEFGCGYDSASEPIDA